MPPRPRALALILTVAAACGGRGSSTPTPVVTCDVGRGGVVDVAGFARTTVDGAAPGAAFVYRWEKGGAR